MRLSERFNLPRQFAALSFVVIMAVAAVSASILSQRVTDRILTRDAVAAQGLVDAFVHTERAWNFFPRAGRADVVAALAEFFSHVRQMPDVALVNAFDTDGRIFWSTDQAFVGKVVAGNTALSEALGGQVSYLSGILGEAGLGEQPTLGVGPRGKRFLEIYVPVHAPRGNATVGVVELYTVPTGLHQLVDDGRYLIWSSVVIGSLFLFLALYWIVHRANQQLERQQQQLVEARSQAILGETASALAHSMRNPLSAIRACAELSLTDDLEGVRESAHDIIGEADRLDQRVRTVMQFLVVAPTGEVERADLNALIREVVRDHDAELARAGVDLDLRLIDRPVHVRANPEHLTQVLGNLLTNAMEAMAGQGVLSVVASVDGAGRKVTVEVRDTGPGIPPEMAGRLFKPFATSKPLGTGLGLVLSKRFVEHYGGTLELRSEPGKGARVSFTLPVVDR